MTENAARLPSLGASASAKVFYVVLAFALTLALFALLPVFDVIGEGSRPALDLVEIPVVAAPPESTPEQAKAPARQERPKPRFEARRELRTLEPLRPDASLARTLALPMTSLQPGLGDVAVDFRVAAPPAPVSKPTGPVAFTVRDLDAPPRLLVPVRPLYPLQARQRGIEGYVDIEFEIEADGTVKTVRVVDSKPPRVFDDSACSAARRWRFSVPLKSGRAVRVLARQRIRFRLEK